MNAVSAAKFRLAGVRKTRGDSEMDDFPPVAGQGGLLRRLSPREFITMPRFRASLHRSAVSR